MIREPHPDQLPASADRRHAPASAARKSVAEGPSGTGALRRRIGNQGIQRLMLKSSRAGDAHEREADRIANAVVRAPATNAGALGAEPLPGVIQGASQDAGTLPIAPSVAADIESMRGGGSRLPKEDREFFEQRFGADFSDVSVHTDARAQEAAKSMGAKAFTVGRDIAFGAGQYIPASQEGRRLVAHELTHVVQQAGGAPRVDRQADLGFGAPRIPTDLQSSSNLRLMTKLALQERYDRIVAVLARFDRSTPDTALLDRQLLDISNELARRLALEQRRTFDPRVIDLMKAYLIDNAKTERDSCIVCMNKGIRKLLEDPNQKLTPKSVEATMEMLRTSGRASESREIGFADVRGRVTRGGGRPHTLRESVATALLEMVGRDVGWSVFGMSLLDGYHSVMLTVDTNDPSSPRIYWSDQWKSKGGWKEYSRSDLDQEITRLIQGWWDDQPVGKKHTTVVRLWRLRQ